MKTSVIYDLGDIRVLSLHVDPAVIPRDIIVQQCVDGLWLDHAGYNSLSNDYAYSSAREEADRLLRSMPSPNGIKP